MFPFLSVMDATERHVEENPGLKLPESHSNGLQAWAPILSDSSNAGALAREAIDAIAQDLVTKTFGSGERPVRPPAAYEEALLYGYLAANGDPRFSERAIECLNQQIETASEMSSYPGLHSGLSGLAWTTEHLSRLFDGGAEAADEDLTADINAVLVKYLQRAGFEHIYDLISGLVGIGVYFLERWPRPDAIQGIRLVFEHLESLAVHTDSGTTWRTGADQLPQWQARLCPNGYYNLGVAHGVPGVIYFLGQISGTGIVEQDRLRRLLDGAVAWVVAQQLPPESTSRFPSWVAPGEEPIGSRFAWCYGDLGIMAVLLQTARRVQRRDWHDFAHALLDQCLLRQPEEGDVVDAPLCHGAAGAAHIFNRIYQSEGDPRCRDASLLWLDRALAMRQPGSGVGGFSVLIRPDVGGPIAWEANPALLDGSIGIALALLAALTPVEPDWDRLLLLSGRRLNLSS